MLNKTRLAVPHPVIAALNLLLLLTACAGGTPTTNEEPREPRRSPHPELSVVVSFDDAQGGVISDGEPGDHPSACVGFENCYVDGRQNVGAVVSSVLTTGEPLLHGRLSLSTGDPERPLRVVRVKAIHADADSLLYEGEATALVHGKPGPPDSDGLGLFGMEKGEVALGTLNVIWGTDSLGFRMRYGSECAPREPGQETEDSRERKVTFTMLDAPRPTWMVESNEEGGAILCGWEGNTRVLRELVRAPVRLTIASLAGASSP